MITKTTKYNKKAQTGILQIIGGGIITFIIILSIAIAIIATSKQQLQEDTGTGTIEYNATANIIDGVNTASSFIPVVVIALIGVAIFGIMQFNKKE